MAEPVARILPVKQPRLPDRRTPEQRYWRSFKTPVIIKETGSVTHTHFSPSSPHSLAISSSARVEIYNPNSRQLIKTISRFKDTVLCAEFREDGKLLVASDKSGAVQVFDLSSRAILRHWTPEETHQRLQVSCVKWLGLTNVVSAGDDNTVKLWDITVKASVQTFTGHMDYARTLSIVPGTNLILSGSLDGTAKLWDPRVSTGAVSTFEHGQGSQGIVYSVLPLKGGTMLVTSGGSGLKVWDMSASTTHPVKEMWNHQKEVTALCGNDDGSRVLAGGLDGHIKIYDVSNWKVVHGVKYPAAILTVSLSPGEKHLAAGMSSALLSLRSRLTANQTAALSNMPAKRLHIQAFKDYESVPSADTEYTYSETKKKKLHDYDYALLGFRFSEALDLVLKKGDPILILTILTELKHRAALPEALHNRSPESLVPILRWMTKHFSDPKYTQIIVDVMYQILDIYGADLLDDEDVAYIVESITRKVNRGIEQVNRSKTLIGVLDMIAKY